MKKRTLVPGLSVSFLLACTVFLNDQTIANAATLNGSIHIKGDVTGMGEKVDGSTDEDVTNATNYLKRYSGPTEFEVIYHIVKKDDNTLDTTKSTVVFDTTTYTSNGRRRSSKFKTLPIPITSITTDPEDSHKILSFMFSGTDWYDTKKVTNDGISGEINLISGPSNFEAKYIGKKINARYAYTLNGMLKPDSPEPEPPPEKFGNPEIFTPVPEASSLANMLGLGVLGVAVGIQRQRAQKAVKQGADHV
ncbi:MAG: hypothetical protein AAGG02_19560 [Cyanobacteria bacterium P01_H01_bin.15]